MNRPSAGLRLGVILLFLIGLLSPVATVGAGAQDLTCDDFNSERAAQNALDNDPDLEDGLDPDGNGIACDDEGGSGSGSGDLDDDAAAYLDDIQGELDDLGDSFERFLEIDDTFGDASTSEQSDMVDELDDIAVYWVDYPDTAADFVAPRGLEDVEDGYLDLADLVGESGEAWDTWWNIPSGDPDEDAALDDFNDVFVDAQDELDAVQDLVDEAGGSGPSVDPTEESDDDPTEEPGNGGDADEYLADIQDEIDFLTSNLDRVNELLDLEADGDATADDADEFAEIMEGWAGYPDVASELFAPQGLEDVEDVYLDLADTVGETGEAWADYLDTDSGSDEEAGALEAFEDGLASVESQFVDLQDGVDESGGGSSGRATEEATEEPGNGGDLTDDEYLEEVSDQADEWNDGVVRFTELLALLGDSDLTDAESDELIDITLSWIDAPEVASDLEAPAGLEDVQDVYEAYADSLFDVSSNFTLFLGSEPDSPEGDEALDAFFDALDQTDLDYDALQDELDAAGV